VQLNALFQSSTLQLGDLFLSNEQFQLFDSSNFPTKKEQKKSNGNHKQSTYLNQSRHKNLTGPLLSTQIAPKKMHLY
jgi:hypothetical protein